MSSYRSTAAVGLVLASLALSGCSASDSPDPAASEADVAVNEDLAKMLPESIAEAGVVRVAMDPTYPPFESVSESDEVVGLDADLAHAIGDLLGLDIEFVRVSFDGIIPSLQAGTADMALSSIGDNEERETVVDFATSYWNGTLLLTEKGNPLDGRADLACNMNVGVVRGSLQQTTFLPAQAGLCEDAGEKAPVEAAYQNSNQAVLALGSDRIDAVLLDAPAAALAVEQTSGSLESVGPIIRNPNPAGIAFPKDSALAEPVGAALNELMENGVYDELLAKWNLTDIAIEESVKNGANE